VGGVVGLQVGVAAVAGVAAAVLVEGRRLADAVVAAEGGGAGPALVDVVAEEGDEGEVLLGGEGPMGGVVAVLVVLARGGGEADPVGSLPGCRSGVGAADGLIWLLARNLYQ